MDPRINIYEKYDDENTERLLYHNKVKQRKKIIQDFIAEAKKNKFSQITDFQDLNYIKNAVRYYRYNIFTSLLLNAILYKYFLTGIYNSGNIYFNMNKYPWYLKLLVSSAVSIWYFQSNWEAFVYNPEYYRIAVNHKNSNINNKV